MVKGERCGDRNRGGEWERWRVKEERRQGERKRRGINNYRWLGKREAGRVFSFSTRNEWNFQ